MKTKTTPGTTEAEAEKENMTVVVRTEKAEAEIETREIVPHDQEMNANTAAAKEKPVTVRYNAHFTENEETMRNDNRTRNKTERNTETTEVNESDKITVTRDERPGNRILADDVIHPCDFSISPKRDMDAEKIVNENEAVRPKCDDEAAAVDEDASSKQEKKANDRRETQHLREVSKQIRKCIRDKKRSKKGKKRHNESLKSSEASRTYPAFNNRKGECSSQKLRMTKAIQSHREKGLQMSSAISTVNYLQAMKQKKNFKIP